MDWKDPRRALPEAPQENQQGREAFRELRKLILDVSREMSFRGTRASIAMDPELNIKEITIEGFVV